VHQECTASILTNRLFRFIHAIEGHHPIFGFGLKKANLRQSLAFSVASLSFHVLADILKVDVMHARHFA
jgi:hypothetical protein